LVDGKNAALIKPRQTYDDIIDLDIVPDWLK
jgi:hypothetical protein